MQTASSAKRTCAARASASECTATVRMPSSRHARAIRTAISPRFAMSIFLNMPREGYAFLMRKSFCPYSMLFPFWAKISTTVPAHSASISFISFIASMMHRV